MNSGYLSRVGRRFFRSTAVAGLISLSACATIPRAELDSYTASFQAAHSAATPIIADYAVAERADRLTVLTRQKRRELGYFDKFEPGDVAAVASAGLPPAAAALDSALAAIARYNDTLLYVAEGRNIGEARAQVQAITGDLAGVAGIAVADGPILAIIQPAAAGLVKALEPAIRAGNERQFRQRVLDGYPHVIALLSALRKATPVQFDAITKPLRIRHDKAAEADQPLIRAQINRWHTVIADYYQLLDAVAARFDALREVVLNPRREVPLALAQRSAADLRAHADALRRSLSEIRVAP